MKARSFCALFSSLLVVTFFSIIPASAQSTDLRNELQTSFTKFDVVRINPGDELRTRGADRTLSVRTVDTNYDLIVTPNDMRSRRYRAEDTNGFGMTELAAPKVVTYKGTIAGESKSEVRLTIDGLRVEGFFDGSGGRLYIEPASKYSNLAQPGDSIIYRAEDSLKDNSFYCEADLPGKIEFGSEMAENNGRTDNAMVVRVLELATESDVEWVNLHGGAAQANAEILSILNMVEGTFNSEVSLTIEVVYQHTWSSSDPFNGATMNLILTGFQTYWNTNFNTVFRDAAHLFSGKTIAQSRGLAYLSIICRVPTASYGISGYVGWAPGKFLVPAHELGHNLGADHADTAQNCGNTLMNASLTGSTPLSFCAFSRDAIGAYVAANNSCLAEVAPETGASFDFDGDGRSDISVFRPSQGVWYLNQSTAGFSAFQFGLNGDRVVASDYDGDGKADAAIYRNGIWYRLRSATNTTDVISFGLTADIPAPADFDGDAKADVAVYRPSTGTWYALASSNGVVTITRFGLNGDVPVAGDYDGDSKADINLFRPSNGTWYRLNSSNGAFYAGNFGLDNDKPLSGDFDGDSKNDVAVWRPSTGVWYVIYSGTGGFWATTFGLAGDIPTVADYDGDGKTDISVYRPSTGIWYRMNSANWSFAAASFGLSLDKPVPAYYIP